MSELVICHFCNDPITKMYGRQSESLLMHHISCEPEVIVPTHHGCHSTDTSKGKLRPIHIPTPKELFRKSLGNEVECYFCDESITRMNGVQKDSLVIHHINGDDNDDRLENLTAAHRGCHQSHHSKGTKMGDDNPSRRPEVRALRSKAMGEGGGGKRIWKIRKLRYGPTGVKDPEAFKKTHTIANRNPEKTRKGWITRRERYGPTGRRKVGVVRTLV